MVYLLIISGSIAIDTAISLSQGCESQERIGIVDLVYFV